MFDYKIDPLETKNIAKDNPELIQQLLPAFQALLKRENGNMSRFFQVVKAIGELSESERNKRLRTILKAPKTREND